MNIEIKPGTYVIVDDCDAQYVQSKTWRVARGYVNRQQRFGAKCKTFSLHRELYEMHNGPIPKDKVIDHINRNKLDNRLCNLRLVTVRQNVQNATHKSALPGVSSKPCRGYEYWIASVYKDDMQVYFGSKKLEEIAFATYQLACNILDISIIDPYTGRDYYSRLNYADIIKVLNNLLRLPSVRLTEIMRMAIEISHFSKCSERQVGTVILSSDANEVLSFGYNGDGRECVHYSSKCQCCHSEVLALMRNDVHLIKNKIIVQTLSPCVDCAKAIIASGASLVVYNEAWKDQTGIKLLKDNDIKVLQLEVK